MFCGAIYILMVYLLRVRLPKMTKVRKISVGDYVTFGQVEWIVKAKQNGRCNLVRRRVLTGPSVWVDTRKLKHADQSWRRQLNTGDTLTLFLSGHWTAAAVIKRVSTYIFVQPSFTNYVEKIHHDSGRIAYMQHDFPVWSEDTICDVVHMGVIRTQRGAGLMFPWEYGETVDAPPYAPAKVIKRLAFKKNAITPGYFPFEFYSRLSNEEIIHDILGYSNGQHQLLAKLVRQYRHQRDPRYPMYRSDDDIADFLEIALSNNDTRRVDELLSIGNNRDLFLTNEFLVREKCSIPFFDLNFEMLDGTLHVDLIWYPRRDQSVLKPNIASILKQISNEVSYNPHICLSGSGAPPEQSYIVCRALGMEAESLDRLFLRRVSGSCWLTLHNGFCEPSFTRFGGVISSYGCDTIALVEELYIRNPLKTLVIVHSDTISDWNACATWHGKRRERKEGLVVTTKNTFTRTWTELTGFQRLICVALPSRGSVYARALDSISCNTRWALLNARCARDIPSAFRALGCPYDKRVIINASRGALESQGVKFPKITTSTLNCEPYEYTNVLENLRSYSGQRKLDYVSKYLMHTSLVPKYLSGSKLDFCEGTLGKICGDFELNDVGKERLRVQMRENCPVCMNQMSDAMITSCGHVFCQSCVSQITSRRLNCPLCRGKIDGCMKVSDKNTDGQLIMHGGDYYRVDSDPKWGSKYDYLKLHSVGTTFITRYSVVKNKLRKEFPKCEILTTSAVEHGARISNNKLICLEPMEVGFEHCLSRAGGEDLDITSLLYKIDI